MTTRAAGCGGAGSFVGWAALAMLGASQAVHAQPFHRLIGFQTEEQAYHVERTSDGGFITTGYIRMSTALGADILVVRHRPDGTIFWSMTFGTPDSHEIGYSVRQTSDGGFIVAGETNFAAGAGLGITLIRLGPGGNVIWARLYPGTAHNDILVGPLPGVAVREIGGGAGFIVVGHRLPIPTGERGVAIRTDGAGNPLFAFEYMDAVLSSQTQLTFTDVRQTVDAAGAMNFDICGTFGALAPLGARDRDAFYMRISGAGAPLFARRYPTVAGTAVVQETGDGFDTFGGPGSSSYMVGRTDFGSNQPGSQIIWLNPVGAFVDARRYRQLETAYAGARLDTAGNLVFVGRVRPTTGAMLFAFMQKFDTVVGMPMWTMLYNWGSANTGDGVCVLPGPGPAADTYALTGGTSPNGYGLLDEYLIRTDFFGQTHPSCPEQPLNILPDDPPINEVPIEIIPLQLGPGTFWQGPVMITLRDNLACVPPPPCDPDINCDGNVDQDDVNCLIDVIAGNPGCACVNPDFNQDGNVDQDDVTALINVIAGGPCP